MKTTCLVVFTAVLNCFCGNAKLLRKSDSILDLIRSAGFYGESHRVVTEDGYRLKVHRILPKYLEPGSSRKPVFLMHGIVATAADFLLTGPDVALGYFLADNGYDVWMGNARGSRHSMKHLNYSRNSKEFWEFSWHEIGFYDLPAMIDYALQVTGASQTFFIGHSQGTTTLLVMLSMRPEYNQKIAQAHLMAASAFRKKTTRFNSIIQLLDYLDSSEEYQYIDLTFALNFEDKLGKLICKENSIFHKMICKKLVLLLIGNNQKEVQLDTRILTNIIPYLSTRVSIFQFTHYYQNVMSDKFRMYDHKSKNYQFYNSSTPPEYPLANVIAPVFMYHASQDLFILKKGAEFLAAMLPNVQQFRLINDWNHIDFVYGLHTREVLYRDILQSINLSP